MIPSAAEGLNGNNLGLYSPRLHALSQKQKVFYFGDKKKIEEKRNCIKFVE